MQNSISRKKFDQHKLWIYEWLNCNSDSNECQVIVATRCCYDKFFKCSAAWSEVKWSEVTHSCPTLCDPMDCSLPDSSLLGILQARVLEWVVISFSLGFCFLLFFPNLEVKFQCNLGDFLQNITHDYILLFLKLWCVQSSPDHTCLTK